MQKVLLLPPKFVSKLLSLPETGMGYQQVKLVLVNGKVISNHTVLNAERLVLNDEDDVKLEDIARIELDPVENGKQN